MGLFLKSIQMFSPSFKLIGLVASSAILRILPSDFRTAPVGKLLKSIVLIDLLMPQKTQDKINLAVRNDTTSHPVGGMKISNIFG